MPLSEVFDLKNIDITTSATPRHLPEDFLFIAFAYFLDRFDIAP